jgi:hypothetical protein
MSPDDQAGLHDGGNRKSVVEVALLLKIFFAVNFASCVALFQETPKRSSGARGL